MGSIYTIEVPSGHRLKIEADTPDDALTAANGWSPSESMTPAQKVGDIAKSAAIGPVKGAISIAGALPDLSATLHGAANKYLFDPLLNATIGPPKINPDVSAKPSDINQMFGSENIRKKVEGVTGPLYDPKTEGGRYAQSATEAIPAALLGPGGLAAKAGIGVGSGVGSEFFGSKYVGTPYEPWARAIGGIVGGVGTMAAGKGIEAVRNIKAAGTAGENIGNILGTDPIKSGAVNRVAGSLSEDGITLPTAQAKQAQLGPDTMVMDLGRQMQGRAEAIAQHPGKAQNLVLDAVEGRTGEFGSGARQRVGDTLDQYLGPSRNVVHVMDDIDNMVQQQAKPAYEKVMADYPIVNVPLEITSRPAVKQAMNNAESLAKNYGEKLSVTEQRASAMSGDTPIMESIEVPAKTSLKYWDYVKKGLDQRINGMMRNGVDDLSSVEKADLGGLLNAKQTLVQHLDNVTGGEYANARRIAATKPELHEAMDFGRSIFSSKLLPEEVAGHIEGLSIPAQAMAQVGARRELERVLDSVRNDGAKARNFLDTNNNLEKIRNLFGDGAAEAIANRVAAENTFQNATQDIAKNSRTSVRQQLRADTETPSPARVDTTLTGLALKGGKAGLNYVLGQGMANTRTGIGQILTAKDQQISPVIEQLLGYNAKRAANAGTPINQQAAALIRALVAGSGSQ